MKNVETVRESHNLKNNVGVGLDRPDQKRIQNTNKLMSNSAVTLIALVLTIIVLLILAGITLNMVLGENGIINKASMAKQKTNEVQELENKKIEELQDKLNNYGIGSSRTEPSATSYNTMSADEHFTGEYYFNGKPIYAKTIYIDALPNATLKKYNHNIKNISNIWCDVSKSWITNNNINSFPIPYTSTYGGTYDMEINNITTQTVDLRTGTNRSGFKAYITLNYTKTTDQGNETTIPATPAN